PLLPGARDLAEDGCVPGGTMRNLEWVTERLDRGDAEEVTVVMLADAQTSGGLLFGAAPDAAAAATDGLRASGHDAAVVGTVTAGTGRLRLGPIG
ncbi:MAG: AIR synthase-related protein, partial [Actinomycetota bacterium]|nr:AIR synthase-related protein [Actinomycetota bacterium]